WLLRERLDGWAFVATGVSIVLLTATIFLNLYPRVMPSSLGAANDLTIWNASSSHYTLKVMTIVALIFTPVVLAYQAWTYWVFRRRVRREDVAEGSSRSGGGASTPRSSGVWSSSRSRRGASSTGFPAGCRSTTRSTRTGVAATPACTALPG